MRTLDNYIEEGLLDRQKEKGSLVKNMQLEQARELFYNSVFLPSCEEYPQRFANIDWNDFKECVTVDNAGEMIINLKNYPKLDVLLMGHQVNTPQLKIFDIKTPNDKFSFYIGINFFKSLKGIFSDECRLGCSLYIESNSYLTDIDGIPEEIYGTFYMGGNVKLFKPYENRTQEKLYKYMMSIIKKLPKYCHSAKIRWNSDGPTREQQFALRKHYPLDHLETRGGWNDWRNGWNINFGQEFKDHMRMCKGKSSFTCGDGWVEFM